jgi:hypothetical protein
MMRWFGLSVLAALASVACGESRLIDDFSVQDTRLRISPESFRGNVPCSEQAVGALQMYVATFQQLRTVAGQPDAGLLRQTSAPVPCDRDVLLLNALAGQPYVADIYGFDHVVSDPDVAEARWTASCGRGGGDGPPDAGRGGPTLPVYGATVPMTGCTFFGSDLASGGGTRLVVDQAGALGRLHCGAGPGEVSSFSGILDGASVSARCGAPLAFAPPSVARYYTIELTAYEALPSAGPAAGGSADALDASLPAAGDAAVGDAAAGDAGGVDASVLDAGAGAGPGEPQDAGGADAGVPPGIARWRSQCVGRALPGATALASCDPLVALPPGG